MLSASSFLYFNLKVSYQLPVGVRIVRNFLPQIQFRERWGTKSALVKNLLRCKMIVIPQRLLGFVLFIIVASTIIMGYTRAHANFGTGHTGSVRHCSAIFSGCILSRQQLKIITIFYCLYQEIDVCDKYFHYTNMYNSF